MTACEIEHYWTDGSARERRTKSNTGKNTRSAKRSPSSFSFLLHRTSRHPHRRESRSPDHCPSHSNQQPDERNVVMLVAVLRRQD